MRGEKHRRPLLFQAQQDFPHLAPCAGVEPCRRLIEEHDLGVVHERNRDPEALLQAPREVLVLLFGFVLEVDELYQPVDIGASCGGKAASSTDVLGFFLGGVEPWGGVGFLFLFSFFLLTPILFFCFFFVGWVFV